MKYESIKDFEDEKFLRLTGIRHTTFEKMIRILRDTQQPKQARGGHKPKLSLKDRLLMMLEYIQEYRICLHPNQSYGMSKSSCCKIIK